MRHLLPALLALGLVAALPILAHGATTFATPTTLAAVAKAAACGDTLLVTGTIGPSRALTGRKCPGAALTIDYTRARITGGAYFTDLEGVTLIGGDWRSTLRMDRAKTVALLGLKFTGAMPNSLTALTVLDGSGVTFVGGGFSLWYKAIKFDRVADWSITGTDFSNLSSDGINIVSTSRGRIANVTMGQFYQAPCTPPNCAHPDAIQAWDTRGPTTDLVIEDNVIDGLGAQCIFLPNAGVRMTIQRNRLTCGQTSGINLLQALSGLVRGNTLSTIPGSPYASKIVTSGAVVRCENTAAAYPGYAGLTEGGCPAGTP